MQWYSRRMIALLIFFTLSFPVYSLRVNDNDNDVDPLLDIYVYVEINRVRTIECDKNETFFIKTEINGIENVSNLWENVMDFEPKWIAMQNVPDNMPNISIKIELWKKDGIQCDISGGSNKSLYIVYDTKTGRWKGDDFLHDASGYGRAGGYEDGNYNENDCEIWFRIGQNDYDNDGLTYWEEVNIYHTNPMESDYGKDYDNDGLPIEWEDYWGYDPFEAETHEKLDPDNDGLNNKEEWLTSQWFSDPFAKDIFIEVDWMEGKNTFSKPYKMPFLSKQYLFSIFTKHFITLHIDDGCMGGGEEIPYVKEPNLRNIYQRYFLHGIKNLWRRGIFHYAVLCGINPWRKSVAGFNFDRDAFTVCIGTIRLYRLSETKRTIAIASLFMHELGHQLGLFWGDFHGIDNESCNFPWRKGWWIYANYKSCMNYRYAWSLIDYSDGSHGEVDYNDWGNLDFYHFKEK